MTACLCRTAYLSPIMLFVTPHSVPAREAWRDEFRAMLALGWPLVLTNLVQLALTTTDVIVVGRLGPTSLAAATLGVNLYLAVLLFGIGLLTATSPMMASAIGRKLHMVRDVRRTFRQGLWSALIIAVPSWIILWQAKAILIAFRLDPSLAAEAAVFMHHLQWGLLPSLGYIVLRSFVAALERPVWALVITGMALVFNIAANYALVFGHFGFPAMGLSGAGTATALSNLFLFAGMVLVVLRAPRFRRYRLFGHWWRPDWPRLRTLWRIGLPIGATVMFEITVFNAAVFLMGQFGTDAIAAHAIAIQIASTTFMVPMGIGQAATVRVGLAYGARDADGITRAGWSAFTLAITFMAAMRAQVGGAGMLRGLQDTRVPMIYAALGYWGIGMSLSLLFAFKLGFGGIGIWIGLASGLAEVACAMIGRWMRRARLGLVSAKVNVAVCTLRRYSMLYGIRSCKRCCSSCALLRNGCTGY